MDVLYGDIPYVKSIAFFVLQKKALRVIYFKEPYAPISPFFFKCKIVKLPNKIKIENSFLICKYVSNSYLPFLIAGLYFPPLLITM